MPYSQSQLRCLNGMGIVPWVERSSDQTDAATTLGESIVAAEKSAMQNNAYLAAEIAASPVAAQNAARPLAAEQTSVVAEPADVLNTDMHAEQLNQSQALSESCAEPVEFMQTPLIEIAFRGKHCTQLGKSDALLLILVEAISTQQNQYPFEPADAKIFEDMLRSIAWRRQDVCLAVLPPPTTPLRLVDDAPSVSDLCKPHRDAVLLFRQSIPETNSVDELVVPLAREGMFAWQLPHPALLRESPNRKRQAWNVLKAARSRLG